MSVEPRRGLLASVALGYTVFVVYGSLVPLDFHPRAMAEALAAFRDIRYLQLGIASRADWVANILLFIPLAYLWLGTVWPQGRSARLLLSAFVGLGCAGLSVAIEFTQIFFPPRTVSINDVLAETIGTAAGIVLWWTTRLRVMAWLEAWRLVRGSAAVSEHLLYGYLFVLLAYNVLPLDLTLSPVEIFHKWQSGRVLVIPFRASYRNAVQMAYDLASDVVIWIPAAFLLSLSARASERRIFGYVVICSAAIEILQLFVYSRTSDSTDVLTAGIGAWLGIAMARVVAGKNARRAAPATFAGWHAVGWLLATIAWMCVLAAVFWYPYNFQNDWGFVHQRLANLRRAPLWAYYWGSEFRAVTEVFHKTGFFFPLGVLAAIGVRALRRRFSVHAGFLHVVGVGLIASVAAVIETGQLFLPEKNADLTDWALETLGGLGGYVLLLAIVPRLRRRASDATDGQRTPRTWTG